MKNNIILILLVIALTTALVFTLGDRRSINKDYKNLEGLLNDTIEHYEVRTLADGQVINEQAQVITTKDNALTAGLVKQEELKARNLRKDVTIVRLQNEIAAVNLEANYIDTVTVYDTVINNTGYISVPRSFNYIDEWSRIFGTVKIDGVTIDTLRVFSEPTIYIGYQRQSFFKPLNAVVITENKNPYLRTTGMQNVVIQQKPPIYKRPWWHRGEGSAATIGVLILLRNLFN